MLNCVVSWIDSGGLVSRLSPGGLGRMVSEEIASHGLRNATFIATSSERKGGWTRNLIIGVSVTRPLYGGQVVGVDR